MRIAIVGTGALGGAYAAWFSRAGHDVSLVARGATLEALRRNGLRVEMPGIVFHRHLPVFAEANSELQADLALVSVKGPALEGVAASVASCLAPDGVALPLINGVTSEERLAQVLGRDRVVGGVAMLAAEQLRPGQVKVHAGGALVLAPLDPDHLPKVERLVSQMAAEFPCRVESNLKTVLWRKMVWNVPFNALCALIRSPAGVLVESEAIIGWSRQIMGEVLAVARAEGASLDERAMDDMIEATRRTFPATIPSMLQDIRAGRRTELDELQGAVVAFGAKHKIATPQTQLLLDLVRGLERAVLAESNRAE